MTNLKTALEKAITHLKKEFTGLQVGRASASLVEDVQVESYGSLMPLKAVANISCPDTKTIKIEPWDKGNLGGIEKAIQEAALGINPQNMGESILLPIPPMTEERRLQLVKIIHEQAENAKISIRNARQEALKKVKQLKENSEISEDQQKDRESDIQEVINKANKEVDEAAKNKETDIKTV